MKKSRCEKCGACCAFFRVSFPDIETDDVLGGQVPFGLTSPLNVSRRFMKGTEANTPRCIALGGKVGSSVQCLIYENRPTVCRNFILSWKNGNGNFLCDRAREYFGLQPFSKF